MIYIIKSKDTFYYCTSSKVLLKFKYITTVYMIIKTCGKTRCIVIYQISQECKTAVQQSVEQADKRFAALQIHRLCTHNN